MNCMSLVILKRVKRTGKKKAQLVFSTAASVLEVASSPISTRLISCIDEAGQQPSSLCFVYLCCLMVLTS